MSLPIDHASHPSLSPSRPPPLAVPPKPPVAHRPMPPFPAAALHHPAMMQAFVRPPHMVIRAPGGLPHARHPHPAARTAHLHMHPLAVREGGGARNGIDTPGVVQSSRPSSAGPSLPDDDASAPPFSIRIDPLSPGLILDKQRMAEQKFLEDEMKRREKLLQDPGNMVDALRRRKAQQRVREILQEQQVYVPVGDSDWQTAEDTVNTLLRDGRLHRLHEKEVILKRIAPIPNNFFELHKWILRRDSRSGPVLFVQHPAIDDKDTDKYERLLVDDAEIKGRDAGSRVESRMEQTFYNAQGVPLRAEAWKKQRQVWVDEAAAEGFGDDTPSTHRTRTQKESKLQNLTAYNCFALERRPFLMRRFPERVGEPQFFARMLGEEWRQLPPEDREVWSVHERCKDRFRLQSVMHPAGSPPPVRYAVSSRRPSHPGEPVQPFVMTTTTIKHEQSRRPPVIVKKEETDEEKADVEQEQDQEPDAQQQQPQREQEHQAAAAVAAAASAPLPQEVLEPLSHPARWVRQLRVRPLRLVPSGKEDLLEVDRDSEEEADLSDFPRSAVRLSIYDPGDGHTRPARQQGDSLCDEDLPVLKVGESVQVAVMSGEGGWETGWEDGTVEGMVQRGNGEPTDVAVRLDSTATSVTLPTQHFIEPSVPVKTAPESHFRLRPRDAEPDRDLYPGAVINLPFAASGPSCDAIVMALHRKEGRMGLRSGKGSTLDLHRLADGRTVENFDPETVTVRRLPYDVELGGSGGTAPSWWIIPDPFRPDIVPARKVPFRTDVLRNPPVRSLIRHLWNNSKKARRRQPAKKVQFAQQEAASSGGAGGAAEAEPSAMAEATGKKQAKRKAKGGSKRERSSAKARDRRPAKRAKAAAAVPPSTPPPPPPPPAAAVESAGMASDHHLNSLAPHHDTMEGPHASAREHMPASGAAMDVDDGVAGQYHHGMAAADEMMAGDDDEEPFPALPHHQLHVMH